jgi:hypothetical protein
MVKILVMSFFPMLGARESNYTKSNLNIKIQSVYLKFNVPDLKP